MGLVQRLGEVIVNKLPLGFALRVLIQVEKLAFRIRLISREISELDDGFKVFLLKRD